MVWIKDYNMFFIHIPKNGGSAIESMFGSKWIDYEAYSDIMYSSLVNAIEQTHITAKMLKKMYPDVYNNTEKFAIVRNPYERMVSEYFWRNANGDKRLIDTTKATFHEFIMFIKEKMPEIMRCPHYEKSHFLSQKNYVDRNVRVFKYENFKECIDFVKKRCNIIEDPEVVNKSEHEHYENYYTKEIKDIVYELYECDFHVFGYNK